MSGGNRPVILAVVASTFFVGFGGGVVFPILPNLGVVLGISPALVGLILSANRFTRIVMAVPAGALVDRLGTRWPFILGLLIEGVATTGYVVAVLSPLPEAWFLLARALWGVGSAFVFATAYTIAADISAGRSVGANMGVVRGGLTLGFPTGLVLGGVVSELYSVTAAFFLAAAFAFVASAIGYLTIPETHVSGARRRVSPFDVERTLPALTVGLVNFGLFATYLGTLFATLVLFLGEAGVSLWGYGPQGMSGFFMAITVLTAFGTTLLGGTLSDRSGLRLPTLLVALAVMIGGFLALATADSLGGLLLACLLVGGGKGGVSGPLMALLADLTPNDRMGRAMATNNVLGDLGGGLGPIVSLPLVGALGFSLVYAGAGLVLVVGAATLVVGVYAHTGELNPRTGQI